MLACMGKKLGCSCGTQTAKQVYRLSCLCFLVVFIFSPSVSFVVTTSSQSKTVTFLSFDSAIPQNATTQIYHRHLI